QRIYHITPANQADALSDIRQNTMTMNEIRSSLAVGREVIVHTDPISVPGWTGAGYVIIDPQTGAGAWKIAGSANGGFLALAGFFLLAALTMGPAIGFVGAATYVFGGTKGLVVVYSLWASLGLYQASERLEGELKLAVQWWARAEFMVARSQSFIVRVADSIYKVIDFIDSKAGEN
ncbi:MAG: hypothetical protein R6U12_08570, partial [Thioalkalivibrio sp.]